MPHSQTSAHRDSLTGVRLARGASPWLLPTVATAALSLVRARKSKRAAAIAVPVTALAAGMLWFFRDPEREIAQGRVISPPTVWCRASCRGRTDAPGSPSS